MPNRRNNWYNLHSTRRYPLDDKSTGTDDDGLRLRDDIINDIHLRFPLSAGRYAFLSGITVSDKLVTAVFTATDDIDNPTKLTPIAVVHALKPVSEALNIAVRPLYPQVGGFIVFGDTTENFVARFSSPRQGLIAPRAARAFNTLPIPTLRRATNGNGLTGLVTLRGQTDVEVVSEEVNIQGYGRQQAMIVRLVQSPIGDNVLEKYIGPCDARPESRNCEKTPVETINGAIADCVGNIDILFCNLEVAAFESCGDGDNPGGVIIDGSIGIDEVCAGQQPERFKGRDLCLPSISSSSLSSLSSFPTPSTPLSSSVSLSSAAPNCADLPYCEPFDDAIADYFKIKIGAWVFEPVESPAESCGSEISRKSCDSSSHSSLSSLSMVVSQIENCTPWMERPALSYRCEGDYLRNVAVWDACAYSSSLEKVVTTDLRLNSSSQENGGIIINWHVVDPLSNPHEEYFHALLDRRENAVRLVRYTGVSPIFEVARVTLGSPAVIGHWYRMKVTTQALTLPSVAIRIEVTGVTNPGWPAVTLTVPTSQFLPDDGLFGLGSIRGVTDFSYFAIKERV